MMKKHYLLLPSLLFCNLGSISAAETKNTANNQEEGNAFVIQFTGDASVCEDLAKKNIPYTNKINGYRIWSWIKGHNIHENKLMDNVDVVTQSEDGTFSESKALNSFNSHRLSDAYHVIAPYKNFAETDHTQWPIRPGFKYSQEELSLVEQLKQDKCVLCKYPLNKQFIIANAQGLPQEVCEQFNRKRAKDFEAKVKRNVHRTWRQAEQEKKQRDFKK